MTELKDKHYIRRIRKGKDEFLISVSKKLLMSKNLKEGDLIDLRTLKKSN